MSPNNKKQRGRQDKQKKRTAQQAAQHKAAEQRAQQETETVREQQEQQRARLQGLFGTPAIDALIQETTETAARAVSTATTTAAAAAATVSSSSSSTAVQETKGPCYHGSSAEHFVAGRAALELIKSYVALNKKYDHDGVQQGAAQFQFFYDPEHHKIMVAEGCMDFVFALGVSLYFTLSAEEKQAFYTFRGEQKVRTAMYELLSILHMGLQIQYIVRPCLFDTTVSQPEQVAMNVKANKYIRDMETERGLIYCLHRETKQSCDCLATKKEEAKAMGKMERCEHCHTEFPKKLMKKCDGCEMVVYCSRDCCSQNWPYHKPFCANIQDRNEEVANNDVVPRIYMCNIKTNDKTKKKKKKKTTAATTSTATANVKDDGHDDGDDCGGSGGKIKTEY